MLCWLLVYPKIVRRYFISLVVSVMFSYPLLLMTIWIFPVFTNREKNGELKRCKKLFIRADSLSFIVIESIVMIKRVPLKTENIWLIRIYQRTYCISEYSLGEQYMMSGLFDPKSNKLKPAATLGFPVASKEKTWRHINQKPTPIKWFCILYAIVM